MKSIHCGKSKATAPLIYVRIVRKVSDFSHFVCVLVLVLVLCVTVCATPRIPSTPGSIACISIALT